MRVEEVAAGAVAAAATTTTAVNMIQARGERRCHTNVEVGAVHQQARASKRITEPPTETLPQHK
jgi:hypothetical protein